jgi:hypothetical protein
MNPRVFLILAFASLAVTVPAQNPNVAKEARWNVGGGCSLEIRIKIESSGERADGNSTVTGQIKNACRQPLTIDDERQNIGFVLYPSDGLLRDKSPYRDAWFGLFSLVRAFGGKGIPPSYSIAANESASFSVKLSDVHWHLGRSSIIDFSENAGAIYKVPTGDWLLEMYFRPALQNTGFVLNEKKVEKPDPIFPFESNSVRVKL